jgi:L-alanine-DL-glutamate epimerase-like enolase superfamily enzyme
MKIKKIILKKYDRPFSFRFHNTQTLRTQADSVIIQLEFENGISGYGESAPRPYVTGENCSTVSTLIRDHFSPLLFFHEIESLKDVEDALDELESECLRKGIPGYSSALGAVDIALLDALGKLKKSHLGNFLGSPVRKEIPYSISIPLLSSDEINELYLQLQKPKLKYVKVLVGDVESDNINRVSFVRSLLSENADIRVEANGTWSFQQAVSNLEKLKRFNITAVEQPVAKNDIESLQRLRRAIDIPIIADESMCSLADARELIASEACDILNIKISKCGGLIRSKQIAKFAESQNVPCQLGAHVGETEILIQAGKAFALTTANLAYFEGYSFLLFENSWDESLFKIDSKPNNAFSNAGLGIGLAEQELIDKYSLPVSDMVSNIGIRGV